MAGGIVCLSVLVWQLLADGEAAWYCACVQRHNNQLAVPYCVKCGYDEDPEDYRRSSGREQGTLLDAVRNTIKRRSSSGSCHHLDQYMFSDNGRMCLLLSDISKQKREPKVESTTYISTTIINDLTASTDIFNDDRTSSGDTQSNTQDDYDIVPEKKETKGSSRPGGVSAGVVVAIAIICFLLGLLAMWLIMKYCRKMVMQDLRHRKGGDKYKMNPPSENVQAPNDTTNLAEINGPDRLPEVGTSVSHRTSYEGLQTENRTSRVYNVIDPAYQTPEQPGSAPSVPNPSEEYFILDKENESDRSASTPHGHSDNNAVSQTNSRNYFILDKDASGKVGGDTTNTIPGKVGDDAVAQHDYFVLEQENIDSVGNNQGENANYSGNTANDYFILEKENDIDKQNR